MTFEELYGQYANWYQQGNMYYGFSDSNFRWKDSSNDPLYKHICDETIEYFNKEFKTKGMSHRDFRQKKLDKEKTERVFGFMKERLEYYNKEGFLEPEEKKEEGGWTKVSWT